MGFTGLTVPCECSSYHRRSVKDQTRESKGIYDGNFERHCVFLVGYLDGDCFFMLGLSLAVSVVRVLAGNS